MARARSLSRSGVFLIATGSAVGQLVAALASPVFSRIYSPAQFGVYTVVSSLAFTFGSVMALRYEMAIPLPVDEDDARDLVVIAVALCFASGTALAAVAWLLGGAIGRSFGAQVGTSTLVAAAAVAAAVGIFQVLNQWALRGKRYAAVARRNALQSTLTVAVQVGAGYEGYGAGLIAGLGIGQVGGILSLLRGSGLFSARRRPAQYQRAAARYRSFPLFLAPAGLLNNIGQYAPLLLVAALYGTQAAGWLGFTQRVLGLPVTLIGQSVAQVYLSEMAKSRREGSAAERELFRIATKRLVPVAAALTITLLAAAPPLFALVFGSTWRTSGLIAQAMSLNLAGQLVASSLSQTLIVYERTALQLVWDIVRLVTTAGAVVTCHALGAGLLTAIWALSIVSALTYLWSWDLSRRTLLKPPRPSSDLSAALADPQTEPHL